MLSIFDINVYHQLVEHSFLKKRSLLRTSASAKCSNKYILVIDFKEKERRDRKRC